MRYAYVKTLTDRNLFAQAFKALAENNALRAGAIILANNWLCGDDKLKMDDRLYNDACLKLAPTIANEISEGSAKKL